MELHVGQGNTALTYEYRVFGRDVLITVSGGVSHIGSVAVGDKGAVSVYTAAAHRDDALAEFLAKNVSLHYQCRCVVTAGFHLDHITREEIQLVLENHEKGCQKLTEALDVLLD